eukprot:701190-Prorocentrum_minimum.AAC.4
MRHAKEVVLSTRTLATHISAGRSPHLEAVYAGAEVCHLCTHSAMLSPLSPYDAIQPLENSNDSILSPLIVRGRRVSTSTGLASADSPPGRVNSPPGRANSPPGRANSPPGRVDSPPGRVNSRRVWMGSPPGRVNSPPGRVNSPSGRVDSPPGRVN